MPLLLVGLAETLIFFTSVYIGAVVVFGSFAECRAAIGPLAPKAAVIAGINLLSLIAMGLYQFHHRLNFRDALARIVVGLILGGLAVTLTFLVFPGLKITNGVAVISATYAVILLICLRYYFVRTVDKNAFRYKTIIYGAGTRADGILDLRRRADRRGFKIVGQVAAPGDRQGKCGTLLDIDNESIAEVAKSLGADEIVIAMDDRRGNLPIRELLDAKLAGINVLDLVEFLERETGKIRVDLVTTGWLIFSSGFQKSRIRTFVKRLVDLFVSFVMFLVTWPIMLAIILAIKIEDGISAPILYRQDRIGKGGVAFNMLKFRSMHADAEKDGKAVWAEKNDARITRVGNVIRNARLDELPQIFNVLRGQMSLVGPRPERPEFVENLKTRIPYYSERHLVKPGLTGWAQLHYPYGASHEDAIEKLQYDFYYVKNHTLVLDVMILLQTVEVVLWSKGAR